MIYSASSNGLSKTVAFGNNPIHKSLSYPSPSNPPTQSQSQPPNQHKSSRSPSQYSSNQLELNTKYNQGGDVNTKYNQGGDVNSFSATSASKYGIFNHRASVKSQTTTFSNLTENTAFHDISEPRSSNLFSNTNIAYDISAEMKTPETSIGTKRGSNYSNKRLSQYSNTYPDTFSNPNLSPPNHKPSILEQYGNLNITTPISESSYHDHDNVDHDANVNDKNSPQHGHDMNMNMNMSINNIMSPCHIILHNTQSQMRVHPYLLWIQRMLRDQRRNPFRFHPNATHSHLW